MSQSSSFSCGVAATRWMLWALVSEKKSLSELSEKATPRTLPKSQLRKRA